MRTSTDSILFEDRSEIGHLIAVLEEWQEDHPDDGKEKMVQELDQPPGSYEYGVVDR